MPTPNENRDPLTGVASRKYVFDIIEGILGHNGQIALILIDVDWMKNYMDHFGLTAGDERLKEIAREIGASSGDNALVFRYGGNEFGVILYETSLEKAREIAETMRVNRKPITVEWQAKQVETLTLSLGIAHFPTHVSNSKYLFWGAELALLKAKRIGKSPFGPTCIGRNRVMAIGDFLDDFPEQSAKFLK